MRLILLEAASYLTVVLTAWGFRRFAKRNVTGDMIAGTIVGAFLEFATEPLWQYHFRITVYKHNTPLVVVLGWGVMFTWVVFLSEKLYRRVLKEDHVVLTDKRIFLFDLVGAVTIAMPIEWFGLRMGIWDYRYDRLGWDWGTIPGVGMPWEALFGYCLLMLIAPSFVRLWQGALAVRRVHLQVPSHEQKLIAEDAALDAEAAELAAAAGFTPFYLLSILFFFLEPVLLLIERLRPVLPKRPFWAAVAVVSVIGWPWSWTVSANHWWSFGPRFMLGWEVIPHLPIEELLFYPLGGALCILLYVDRYRGASRRPAAYWAFLALGTAAFAVLAWLTRAHGPYYLLSQMLVYNAACGLALAPWVSERVDLRALALPVAAVGLLGFVWDFIAFSNGWWAYHAVTGLRVGPVPVDDFNFFLFAPTAAVAVYHSACAAAGAPVRLPE